MFNLRVAILLRQRGQIWSCSLKAPNWLFPSCCLLVIQGFRVYFRTWAHTMTLSKQGSWLCNHCPPVIAAPWPKLIAASLFFLESALAAGHLSEVLEPAACLWNEILIQRSRYTSEKAMAEVTLNNLFGHDCKTSMLDAEANSAFGRR